MWDDCDNQTLTSLKGQAKETSRNQSYVYGCNKWIHLKTLGPKTFPVTTSVPHGPILGTLLVNIHLLPPNRIFTQNLSSPYLSELLDIKQPPHYHRLSSIHLTVPPACLTTMGARAFSHSDLHLWTSLSSDMCDTHYGFSNVTKIHLSFYWYTQSAWSHTVLMIILIWCFIVFNSALWDDFRCFERDL